MTVTMTIGGGIAMEVDTGGIEWRILAIKQEEHFRIYELENAIRFVFGEQALQFVKDEATKTVCDYLTHLERMWVFLNWRLPVGLNSEELEKELSKFVD